MRSKGRRGREKGKGEGERRREMDQGIMNTKDAHRRDFQEALRAQESQVRVRKINSGSLLSTLRYNSIIDEISNRKGKHWKDLDRKFKVLNGKLV